MKRYTPFLSILFLMLCEGIFAQPVYNLSGNKEQYYKELHAWLASRNISAGETELYVRLQSENRLKQTSVHPAISHETSGVSIRKGSSSSILDSTNTCDNIGFENSAVGSYTAGNSISGWVVDSRFNNANCSIQYSWTPGSPEFSIVSTPVSVFPFGMLPHSPLGGTKVAQLNNTISGSLLQTRLTRSIAVNTSNYKFVYAFASLMQDGSHYCCEQANMRIQINNSQCDVIYVGTPGSFCSTVVATGFSLSSYYYFSGWQVDTLNLFPFIGTTVDINFISSDCVFAGHFGSMFVDAQCDNSPISCAEYEIAGNNTVSFCQGASTALIHGVPNMGFSSYQWIPPSGTLSAQQASSTVLTVTNPVPGAVYKLKLGVPGVCSGFIATYTLAFTQTSIKCLETLPSCLSNPSGAATVIARGSGTGYQYTWSSPVQTVTNTNSVVTGLAPGVYTVQVSVANPSTCGTAQSVFTISSFNGAAPSLSISPPSAHLCAGQQATLNALGSATSFTWSGGANSSAIQVSPLTPAFYTVTAGNSNMPCTSTVSAYVNVSSVNLNASASKTTICPGETVILNASGTQNVSWNTIPGPGTKTVVPAGTTVYTVLGTSVFSAITCSAGATLTVNVRPAPYVFVTGSPRICFGDSSTYFGGGASVYTWHTGEINSSMSFTTQGPGVYSVCVNGVDTAGCQGNYCLRVDVGLCTGLTEQNMQRGLLVYPNPSQGEIVVHPNEPGEFFIYNELMQIVFKNRFVSNESEKIKVKLPPGIYFVSAGIQTVKVIVE